MVGAGGLGEDGNRVTRFEVLVVGEALAIQIALGPAGGPTIALAEALGLAHGEQVHVGLEVLGYLAAEDHCLLGGRGIVHAEKDLIVPVGVEILHEQDAGIHKLDQLASEALAAATAYYSEEIIPAFGLFPQLIHRVTLTEDKADLLPMDVRYDHPDAVRVHHQVGGIELLDGRIDEVPVLQAAIGPAQHIHAGVVDFPVQKRIPGQLNTAGEQILRPVTHVNHRQVGGECVGDGAPDLQGALRVSTASDGNQESHDYDFLPMQTITHHLIWGQYSSNANNKTVIEASVMRQPACTKSLGRIKPVAAMIIPAGAPTAMR
ncbi:hypothetical protein ES703_23581 [subsurface metagenome]